MLTALNFPTNLKDMIFNCCEELELLAREYSNDEGQQSAVATGPTMEVETAHPDYLIKRGLQQSVLKHVPMPQPTWESPLPEHTPGLLQKGFPFVFRSGDADPWEERPRDIKYPKTSWETRYMEWVSKLPEAQDCIEIQFYLNGRAQRIASRKQVQIAIKNTGINRDDLPTK